MSWKKGTYSSFGGGFSFGLFSNRLSRRSGSSGGLSGANLKNYARKRSVTLDANKDHIIHTFEAGFLEPAREAGLVDDAGLALEAGFAADDAGLVALDAGFAAALDAGLALEAGFAAVDAGLAALDAGFA